MNESIAKIGASHKMPTILRCSLGLVQFSKCLRINMDDRINASTVLIPAIIHNADRKETLEVSSGGKVELLLLLLNGVGDKEIIVGIIVCFDVDVGTGEEDLFAIFKLIF